jgi:hypothetical protein
MLASFIIGFITLNRVCGFSSRHSIQRKPLVSTSTLYKALYFAEEVAKYDQPENVNGVNGVNGVTAMDVSVYEKLGIHEPDLALGINADEVRSS